MLIKANSFRSLVSDWFANNNFKTCNDWLIDILVNDSPLIVPHYLIRIVTAFISQIYIWIFQHSETIN